LWRAVDIDDKVVCLAIKALLSPVLEELFLAHGIKGGKKLAYLVVSCFRVDIIDINMLKTVCISPMEHGLTGEIDDVPKTSQSHLRKLNIYVLT
jgi:hypothetical protein